jgi:hypothetical protein
MIQVILRKAVLGIQSGFFYGSFHQMKMIANEVRKTKPATASQ